MKRRDLLILSLFIPVLFTSCLANILNDKFGYSVPIVIEYDTKHATTPKRIKVPAGQPLTKNELPELSEQGYYFSGWYSDPNYSNKIEIGAVLKENTTLYALWIPKGDTPFTIYNYFFNPREKYEYVLKPEYTQHLTGTTDQVVYMEYNLKDFSPYTPELEDYRWLEYFSYNPELRTIKGDGSTIINNYFYLYKIYDYEFVQMFPALPDDRGMYSFTFINQGASFPFSSVKTALQNNCKVVETFYDDYLNKTIYRYNKYAKLDFVDLTFTEIPSYAFSNTNNLMSIVLPSTCTRINQGAFYGCSELVSINLNNYDNSRTWHCSNGSIINSNTTYEYVANLLKSDENIYMWVE